MAHQDSSAPPAHPSRPDKLKKKAECVGCRQRFPLRELVTVHEGRHDNLHFFNGDLICRPCAREGGVEF